MSQDLRKLFKLENASEDLKMKKDHTKRFKDKLNKAIPVQKNPYTHSWKIAASFLILISVGLFTYNQTNKEDNIEATIVDSENPVNEDDKISLGNLSPDLKKIEDYYQVNINLELSQLDISNDNKVLVDSYMYRLSELHTEYQKLNEELNTIGPNDQLISALINNLQLRLQLLQKLRTKLNELKSTKNETIII